ncbi:hypothetical protein Taro_028688, partial [Colocasia esculenta]|nr:hypothetical protein [Colocasia esculenta]
LGSSVSSASPSGSPAAVLPGEGPGCSGKGLGLKARRGGAATAACRRMVVGMRALNLIFSEARRSLILTFRSRATRTGQDEEGKGRGKRDSENNKSWLLADAQTEKEEEAADTTLFTAPATEAAMADPHSAHSSFRFSFGSQLEFEPTVLMVSEDEQSTAPPSSTSREHTLLIKWRRLESLERSISPVTGALVRFSYPEISLATHDFHPGRVLGRGALSRVYRGKVAVGAGRRGASAVAVKRLQGEEKECAKAFCRELMVASSLCHPNVVPLLGFCVDPQGLFLVYKFVSGGSLDQHLHPEDGDEGEEEVRKQARRRRRRGRWVSGGGGLPWGMRWKVAVGIARAVEYLHQGTDRCVLHRDIKPSNILLSSKKTPKLCDFGLATWTHGPSLPFLCKTVKGTFGYLAPEYFQHGKLSDKTDIYAYGVLLLELITGRKPIDTSRPQGDENLVLWAKPLLQQGETAIEGLVDPRLKLTSYSQVEISRMVRTTAACLNSEEARRPRISQVIGMLHGTEENCEDWSVFTGSGCFAGFSPQLQDPQAKNDMRDHLTLAMLGISDNEEDDVYGR